MLLKLFDLLFILRVVGRELASRIHVFVAALEPEQSARAVLEFTQLSVVRLERLADDSLRSVVLLVVGLPEFFAGVSSSVRVAVSGCEW